LKDWHLVEKFTFAFSALALALTPLALLTSLNKDSMFCTVTN